MMAKRVDGGVGGDVADGLGGGPPLGLADTDILVEATVVAWRMRDVRNDVRLPTRDGGGRDLQEAGFRRTLGVAAQAKKGTREIPQERR